MTEVAPAKGEAVSHNIETRPKAHNAPQIEASPSYATDPKGGSETIEERCFTAALICLEGHFTQIPPMGPLTAAKVSSIISRTLEKTHTLRTARSALRSPLFSHRLESPILSFTDRQAQRNSFMQCFHLGLANPHFRRGHT